MSETHYRTDGDKLGNMSVLPFRLRDGYHIVVEIPVWEASESDMVGIDGIRAHTYSEPAFRVSIDLQRNEDGDETIFGLWDPDDDEETYLGHSCAHAGVGYSHYDKHRTAVNIEEWLNDLLTDEPERVEPFITADRRGEE